MKKYILVVVMLFSFSAFVRSQEENSGSGNQTIFLELGGSGFLYSINYEHLITESSVGRIGVSHFPGEGFIPTFTTLPFGISSLIPLKTTAGHQYFELGWVATILFEQDEEQNSFSTGPVLGFRVHNQINGGGYWRLTFTPFYSPSDRKVYLWGGVSIGTSF